MLLVNLLVLLGSVGERRALAFCRTTTCKVPASFQPTQDHCLTDAIERTCVIDQFLEGKTPHKPRPLWWRNRCVGYSMNVGGTSKLAFDDVSQVAKKAFALWTNSSCPGATDKSLPECPEGANCAPISVVESGSRVSIDARDLGTVECNDIGYFSGAANQNTILFRDTEWSDTKKNRRDSNVLALTTVSFDPTTGEIRSADLEVNTFDHDFWIDSPDPAKGGNDFELLSVFAHEMGHFFGLAHSPDPLSLMFWSASGVKHDLTTDDIAGICTIYPPSGKRSVHKEVSSTGFVEGERCDPTPRGGLGQTCAPRSGCAVTPTRTRGNTLAFASFVTLAWAFFARRGKRRRRRTGQ